MKHRDKPEAYFCNRREMWICDLAETICEATKEEAENKAKIKIAAYKKLSASPFVEAYEDAIKAWKETIKTLHNSQDKNAKLKTELDELKQVIRNAAIEFDLET